MQNQNQLFPVRSLAFSAFRSGGLRGLTFRSSSRSFSRFVGVASFSSVAAAARFARRWSVRLGVSVAVSGLSVSVPCLPPRHSRWPSWVGRPVFFGGGVRGLVAGLSRAGVV